MVFWNKKKKIVGSEEINWCISLQVSRTAIRLGAGELFKR